MDGNITGFSPTNKFSFDLQRFEDTPATELTVTEVNTVEALTTALSNDGIIKLTGDIELTEALTIGKNITLDLNGHTITSTLSGTDGRAIKVTNGTFTLRDTSANADGKIIANTDNQTGNNNTKSTNNNTIFISGGKFIMESGTVEITNSTNASRAVNAVFASEQSGDDLQVEIKGGTILGTYIGLSVGKNAKAAVTGSNTTIATKNTLASPTGDSYNAGDAFGIVVWGSSKVTVGTEGDTAGPTITAVAADSNTAAEAVAVSGNGKDEPDYKSTTIEILSGSLSATGGLKNNLGIYNPSVDSTLTIKGGTITGGDANNGGTGVEVRAATKVEVTGGTITGTGSFSATKNGDGSTSKGAGIAIAQHNTGKNINVNVSGDAKVSGTVALSVTNPNDRSETNSIELNVTGGEFEGTDAAVFYQDDRSGLDVTDGNFKGAVITTYKETNTDYKVITIADKDDEEVKDAFETVSSGEEATTTYNDKVKIAGGTYNSESVEKYTTNNGNSDSRSVYNSQTGTYGVVNAGAGWTARGDSDNKNFDYIISSGGESATLLAVSLTSAFSNAADSIGYFKADSLNRVLGVQDNTSNAIAGSSLNSVLNNALTAKYSWLTFTTADNAVSITPQVAGVKIIGTDIIGTATKLTVDSPSGAAASVTAVTVSGADNSLSSIFSNKGDDSIVAGARATTIDGGDGADIIRGSAYADSLKGGGGADKFYYSGGADTIADFGGSAGTDLDEVVLDGLTPITDGTKITSNTNSFTLNFGKGNTLTFQKGDAANLPSVSVASSQHYVYTKDWVMEEGKSVTLASAVKSYEITGDVMTVDGSAAAGNLTITDHAQDNNNYVTFGGEGKNTFNYKSGNDVILGYNYDNGDGDVVSLASNDLKAPIDFTNATYDGSNFVLKLDPNSASKTLTFKGAANVALLQTSGNETDTYTYKAIAANKLYSIAQEGKGISLGAGYTSTQYNGTSTEYATIDAANVTQAIRIRGNDKANYIVSSSLGGVLEGNDEDDTLMAVTDASDTASLTLNGGAGNDLLEGGSGYNYFIYSEGSDSIKNYGPGNLINVTGREVSFADVTVDTAVTNNNDLLIKFDNDNQLSIAGGASAGAPVISITSGRNNYAVKKDYIALNGKSITLAAGYGVTNAEGATYRVFNGAADTNTVYTAINAAAVTATGGISIVGNDNNNYIIGSETKSNSLNGGAGNDTLVGVTVPAEADLFYYTAGKDVIENFGASTDKLAIEDTQVAGISSGKLTNSKLTFTVDKNNSLTFKFGDNEPFEKVSLEGTGYLTKDGVVSIPGGTGDNNSLKLFASAKGKIDLNDELYSLSADSAISTVDAEKVKSQSVTLVGGTQGGLFAYMENNKQRDGFEYGGGNVTISGYEGGRDRIDLGDDSLTKFEIIGSGDNKDVKLTLGDSKTISIKGAAGKEVLLRDTSKGNGYKKMVFAATGVVQNKAKNPTMATVSAGVDSYSFADSNHNAQTVKKIYVTDAETGTSIRAGDKYNTVIDASKATNEVSLSGGAKNDKLIGSTVDADDLFVYTGGKDVIQNFGMGDRISIDSNTIKASLDAGNVKITAAKKSIKFKFGNKDVLTIKSNETMDGALKINDGDKIYFKNAIGESNGSVSLTSAFSGTFKTQDSNRTALPKAATVNGGNVEKNLTFKGSSDAETLIGGSNKNRKTMFRGGGGADSLVGGASKDTFFYAKGNTGDANIANFDFANDKIKVSSGIISKIENLGSAIKFSMTNGKSTDAAVGSFNIMSGIKNGSTAAVTDFSKVAIKANNTYYWFTESGGDTYYSASTGDTLAPGTLITTENRLKSAPSDGYAVIDLNYSTNLAKNDIVAVKATTTNPNTTTT